MSTYKATIGMEIHVELKTQSKMFSSAPNKLGMEEMPNDSIDPVTTAQPGSLPVPNKEAITFVQMAGLGLNCEIARKSKFDRKNYFYPDLPKGYQISQYDMPLCENGHIMIGERKIGITRIHMEEDTGKSTHPQGGQYTLVDLNRAGVPLMELVTEPDITSGPEARLFCQKIQQVFRYLGIADADMEKGQMRCEVNISLYKDGADPLSGQKVEIKNLNSFKVVEKAIDYEMKRQAKALDNDEKIVQETRGWDDKKGKTVSQRKKENANDYRYFPEPDIPPMVFTDAYVDELKRSLPELPHQKEMRFMEEYNLSNENCDVITADKDTADFFEHVVSEIVDKKKSGEMKSDEKKVIKLAANYLVSELQKYLIKEEQSITDMKISAENFAELMGIIADGTINSSAAQTVLYEMYYGDDDDPSHIIEEKNLAQMSDSSELDGIVEKVLAANEQSVTDYKAGKENAIKYLMGQVMKESHGKANPQMVMEMLREKLV
ncbi:MAG: Asp-tRNA(Asn)/Glu-tRNA(Gln) amidotransferase GatCAB subunit B [Candidatus Moraniibacteriota bacterium]|nr:MAG: Asp-tRNA(Asn)/Glu-tRNA(Gln) amidotransferase GatCAB subunit B [Candidatus Moranbacteria bacterium]